MSEIILVSSIPFFLVHPKDLALVDGLYKFHHELFGVLFALIFMIDNRIVIHHMILRTANEFSCHKRIDEQKQLVFGFHTSCNIVDLFGFPGGIIGILTSKAYFG